MVTKYYGHAFFLNSKLLTNEVIMVKNLSGYHSDT